jgi:hypothetical protein
VQKEVSGRRYAAGVAHHDAQKMPYEIVIPCREEYDENFAMDE